MAGAPTGYYSEVLLGYVDERIDEKHESSCDYTTNKIGGVPNWMPGKAPSKSELSCPLCNSYLSLISQVYAPLENSSLHRTLYLFACLRKKCWNSSKSWKCFRSEVEDTSPSKPVDQPNLTVNNTSFQTTDWADDAEDWGSEDDENGNTSALPANMLKGLSLNDNYPCKDYDVNECEDDDDEEEEEGEEDEVSTTSTSDFSTSNDNNANDLSHNNKKSSSVAGAAGELRATAVIEEENEGETNVVIIDSPDEAAKAAAATTIPSLFFPADNVNPTILSESFVFQPHYLAVEEEYDGDEEIISEHERRLLWEFRSKESVEEEEEKGLLLNRGACSGTDTDVYEKAVPRHGDTFYHKFLTIIQKNPGQVLRYSRDNYKGPLLVSKLSSPSKFPDKCSYCGGPLVFEFQILSSLVSFLETPSPGEGEIEFGTVIVFTCKKSCSTSNETLKVEHILVQAEPM